MASLGRYERNTNIWPGFVDALATLLMVVIFLLMIFVLAQFFLGQALSGRDTALQRLETQVTELADLLALEKRANTSLTENLAQMSQELQTSVSARDSLRSTVNEMRVRADETAAKIDTMFTQMSADKEQLRNQNLELASLGTDISSLKALRQELEAEVAKLAARASALETIADEEKQGRTKAESQLAAANQELESSKETLEVSIEELMAVRKSQASTAKALSAARNAQEATSAELAAAQKAASANVQELASTRRTLLEEKQLSKSARAQLALLNKQMSVLRTQLARLEEALEASETSAKEKNVQIVNLGKRLNAALASKVQELSRYRSEFFGRLRELLGNQRGIQISGDRFVFQSEVLFDKGSADIGVSGKSQLTALAGTLKTIAAKIPDGIDWVLRVDGHTDSDPINTPRFPSNWELSSARAIAVVRQLVADGLPSKRLVAAGFGQYRPIDARADEIAKRRNRRIELKLTQR